VWIETFPAMAENNFMFEGILLKPSTVNPGADCRVVDEVPERNVASYNALLYRCIRLFEVDKLDSKSWDPELAEGLRFIEFVGLGSAFHSAQHYLLPIVWWMQRKCGCCPGRNLTCHVPAYGIHGCKLSSELQVFRSHHVVVRGAVKPPLVSEDSDSSWKLFEVTGLLDVHWLIAAVSEVLILWFMITCLVEIPACPMLSCNQLQYGEHYIFNEIASHQEVC
jgi:hypothetical protein